MNKRRVDKSRVNESATDQWHHLLQLNAIERERLRLGGQISSPSSQHLNAIMLRTIFESSVNVQLLRAVCRPRYDSRRPAPSDWIPFVPITRYLFPQIEHVAEQTVDKSQLGNKEEHYHFWHTSADIRWLWWEMQAKGPRYELFPKSMLNTNKSKMILF